MQPEVEQLGLTIFLATFVICALLILCARLLPAISIRPTDLHARQAAHLRPTSRLGGVGVVGGLLLGLLVVAGDQRDTTILLVIVSVLPVFAAGLAEDLGLRLKPAWRLVAAFIASFIALALLGQWVVRSDIALLDMLLMVPVAGIFLTALWGAGMCHAFNLIDGVNGLSSGAAILTALGLAFIAHKAGEPEIAFCSLLLVASIFGFAIFNWPFGRLFLGDAGAYSIGHILAWLGILLVVRAPEVSVLAVAGVFFWPIADTCLAIYRRRRSGKRTDQPDRLHFHQIIMRAVEIKIIRRRHRQVSNPLTSVLLLPIIGLCIWSHCLFWNMPTGAAMLWAVQAISFILLYAAVIHIARFPRKRRSPVSPQGFEFLVGSVQYGALRHMTLSQFTGRRF